MTKPSAIMTILVPAASVFTPPAGRDSLVPKANALNAELAKPEVEPSRLTQLASQLTDRQKQVTSLRSAMK